MVFRKCGFLVFQQVNPRDPVLVALDNDESGAVNPLAINENLMTRAEAIYLVGKDPSLIFVEPVTKRMFHTRPPMRTGEVWTRKPDIPEGWAMTHLRPRWSGGVLTQVHPVCNWPRHIELPDNCWTRFGVTPPPQAQAAAPVEVPKAVVYGPQTTQVTPQNIFADALLDHVRKSVKPRSR